MLRILALFRVIESVLCDRMFMKSVLWFRFFLTYLACA